MTVGEGSDASHDEDEKWTSEKLFHSVIHRLCCRPEEYLVFYVSLLQERWS